MDRLGSLLSLWLPLLLLLCFSTSISSAVYHPHKIPRLSPIRRTNLRDPDDTPTKASLSEDFKSYFYEQTLDHFNYNPQSYTKFNQSYVINSKFWVVPVRTLQSWHILAPKLRCLKIQNLLVFLLIMLHGLRLSLSTQR